MIPHHKVQKPHLLAATQAPLSHSFLPLNDNIGDPYPHPDPYVFGLPDPFSDPLVTKTDPAPDPSIIKQK